MFNLKTVQVSNVYKQRFPAILFILVTEGHFCKLRFTTKLRFIAMSLELLMSAIFAYKQSSYYIFTAEDFNGTEF